MKIAIIAANGRTGMALVKTAIEAGHWVNAGIRGANIFNEHPNLKVMTCDATIQQDVERLIRGQDAVVSLIGHVKGSPNDIQTKAIKTILDAMEAEEISQLISLTGTGVRQPGDKIILADRLLNFLLKLAAKPRLLDGINHAELLKNSQANYTIIRVLKLTDGKPKNFSLKINGPVKLTSSRLEVAKAILQVLESGEFSRQMPIISKADK